MSAMAHYDDPSRARRLGWDADAVAARGRTPQMLARLYRDGGQTVTIGNPPIALPLGRGLGGTTLVNSGDVLPDAGARARSLAA